MIDGYSTIKTIEQLLERHNILDLGLTGSCVLLMIDTITTGSSENDT